MDRTNAYAMACKELRSFEAMSYEDVVSLVGQPPKRSTVLVGELEWTVEVRVDWQDQFAGIAEVVATIEGPSSWKLERLVETFTIRPSAIS
jgi:hypothetical protein